MRKILRKFGLIVAITGTILAVIATTALLIGPGPDPTGFGELYDEQAEDYNKRMKDIADTDPTSPAPALANTRLQLHRQNATFGLIVSGLMVSAGLFLYFRNRCGT